MVFLGPLQLRRAALLVLLGCLERGPWVWPVPVPPSLMAELFPGGFDPALGPTAEEEGRKTRGSMRNKVEGSHREKTKAHGTEATGVA